MVTACISKDLLDPTEQLGHLKTSFSSLSKSPSLPPSVKAETCSSCLAEIEDLNARIESIKEASLHLLSKAFSVALVKSSKELHADIDTSLASLYFYKKHFALLQDILLRCPAGTELPIYATTHTIAKLWEHVHKKGVGSPTKEFINKPGRRRVAVHLLNDTPIVIKTICDKEKAAHEITTHFYLASLSDYIAPPVAGNETQLYLPLAESTLKYTPETKKLITYCSHLLQALTKIHTIGEHVHGDLKPKNVLLFTSGDEFVAKLADFGSSYPLGTEYEGGTPYYSAPEVTSRPRAMPARDMWSFGVTIFEAFTGSNPFKRDKEELIPETQEEITALLSTACATLSEEHLEAPESRKILSLVKSCLQLEPTDRPPASELLKRLEESE